MDHDEFPWSFVGRDPGNTDTEFLVTMWGPTEATIAYRSDPSESWGPPHALERRDF